MHAVESSANTVWPCVSGGGSMVLGNEYSPPVCLLESCVTLMRHHVMQIAG